MNASLASCHATTLGEPSRSRWIVRASGLSHGAFTSSASCSLRVAARISERGGRSAGHSLGSRYAARSLTADSETQRLLDAAERTDLRDDLLDRTVLARRDDEREVRDERLAAR